MDVCEYVNGSKLREMSGPNISEVHIYKQFDQISV